MITRTTAPRFQVGEEEFKDLDSAKIAALQPIIQEGCSMTGDAAQDIASALLAADKTVIDILTTTDTSLARARKINGGRKNRKAKEVRVATAEPLPVNQHPFDAGNNPAA